MDKINNMKQLNIELCRINNSSFNDKFNDKNKENFNRGISQDLYQLLNKATGPIFIVAFLSILFHINHREYENFDKTVITNVNSFDIHTGMASYTRFYKKKRDDFMLYIPPTDQRRMKFIDYDFHNSNITLQDHVYLMNCCKYRKEDVSKCYSLTKKII